MMTFGQWLESRHMDSYVNKQLAVQLNRLRLSFESREELVRALKGLKGYNWHLVDPASELGSRMHLPSDYWVVAGDDGFALLNFDNGRWVPLPEEYMPQPNSGEAEQLGRKTKNIPDMEQPGKYDFFEPTTPSYPVGSGNPPGEPGESSWYNREKVKRKKL